MIWDCAIVYIGLALAIAGWNLGLRNMWPSPLAMVLATAITQLTYVQFSTILLDQTHLPPDLSFFTGYVMIWLVSELLLECAIAVIVPIRRQHQDDIGKLSRTAGACLGLVKTLVLMVFATAATVSSAFLPDPPQGQLVAMWLSDSAHESSLLRGSRKVAARMPASLAKHVLSHAQPIYEPKFEPINTVHINTTSKEDWKGIFESLRQLEVEISNL